MRGFPERIRGEDNLGRFLVSIFFAGGDRCFVRRTPADQTDAKARERRYAALTGTWRRAGVEGRESPRAPLSGALAAGKGPKGHRRATGWR